jgi:uncharacterized HAD superfamily protein
VQHQQQSQHQRRMIGQKQNQSGNRMTSEEVKDYGERVEQMAKKNLLIQVGVSFIINQFITKRKLIYGKPRRNYNI